MNKGAKMKIKNTFPVSETDIVEAVFEDGRVDIVAEDGRDLYSLRLLEDGTLEVSVSGHVKHGDKILDTTLSIKPKASNLIEISRPVYK
jgi:hypothetical protein